jgi:hypothetical protein
MSTIFSIIHRRRMITVNGGNLPISYNPAQQNTVVIHKPVRECISRVEEFFNLHQGSRIIQYGTTENHIIVKITMSWQSWGEIIEVRFTPLEPQSTRVDIVSRPVFAFALIDFGRNLNNVHRIVNHLQLERAG